MDFKKISRNAPRIGIVGITGAVGLEMISILASSNAEGFFSEIRVFASEKNKGRTIRLGSRSCVIQALEPGCFQNLDLIFFDALDEVSKAWVGEACASGAWVIDHSGVHRMNADVVLGLPGVNDEAIKNWARSIVNSNPKRKLISGPNCSTAGMVMALAPLQKLGPIESVCVSTFQSVSGAGQRALGSLIETTEKMTAVVSKLDRGSVPTYPVSSELQAPIAYSLIPKIGKINPENRYTSEENKIREETRKILGLPDLKVSATAVRVPTLRGHAASIRVQFSKPFMGTLYEIRKAYENTAGVVVMDGDEAIDLPKNQDIHGKDFVAVGRFRLDPDEPHVIHLFCFSDNLRKGAALNALQIAECLWD